MDDAALDELVARAVTTGATPGPSAHPDQIAAAERRLGVRFDPSYRRFLERCNGLEKLGDVDLYPVDELGLSSRWRDNHHFLVGEYFAYEPTFEMRGNSTIEPEFHPAPPGQKHVLIGYRNLSPTSLVCNFSISDPSVPPGEVADCRYEPALLGTFDQALTDLVEFEEESIREDPEPTFGGVRDQTYALFDAIKTGTLAPARHALSARRRSEFDRLAPVDAIDTMRQTIWPGGTLTGVSEPDPSGLVHATFELGAGYRPSQRTAGLRFVREDLVWRVDSWNLSD